MKQLLLSLLILLFLPSCGLFQTHKMDIEQGNVLSEQAIEKLHTGMSEATVRSIMGTPMLVNVFTPNRYEYIYTFQAGYGKMQRHNVSCLFNRGVLQKVTES